MMLTLKISLIGCVLFFARMCAEPLSPLHQEIQKMCETFQEDHDVIGLVLVASGWDHHQVFEQIVTLGTLSKKSSIPINCYTEFRLGPLTQIFTAAVLAYFVQEGRVSLDDPVSKFLPKSVQLPTYQGKQITLGDLATHTAALPDMPHILSDRTTFSVLQMYRFLSKYTLPRAPGSRYEYSNLGYSFLANILTRIAKRSFPDLLHQVILHPLNLKDTTFTLSREQKSRYAIGYEGGRGVSPLDYEKIYSVFIGAGGLSSTAENMLTWLLFHLGKEKTSLNALLSTMQNPYHTHRHFMVGLPWKISHFEGIGDALFHIQGELFGFSTYMGIIPKQETGLVLIVSQGDFSVAPFGEKLLKKLSKHFSVTPKTAPALQSSKTSSKTSSSKTFVKIK